MKKYLFLAILTLFLFGLTANIDAIEASMAYSANTVQVTRQDTEKTVVCTGSVYKTAGNAYYAKIFINENSIVDVKTDQKVRITATALGEKTLNGTLISLADTAQTIKIGSISQTVVEGVVKIDSDAAANYLRTGYTVTVSIITQEDFGVLVVPFSAIVYDEEERYVYEVSGDWAIRTSIHILEETAKGAVVAENTVNIGDCLVIDPEKISKGTKYIRFSKDLEIEEIG